MISKRNAGEVKATICLYGRYSAGWIAELFVPGTEATSFSYAQKMLGDGMPVEGRSFTEAVYQACAALVAEGYTGDAWVFEPSGLRKALVSVNMPKYFGDLKWESAEVYTISSEQILAAAAQ